MTDHIDILPIRLPPTICEKLIMEHCRAEFEKEARFHTTRAYYEFNATVLDLDGNCDMYVWYNDDDGFCKSGGCLFKVTKQIFTKEAVKNYIATRKATLAMDARFRAEQIKIANEVAEHHKAMFGTKLPTKIYEDIVRGNFVGL